MAISRYSIHCAYYEDIAAADADFQALNSESRGWSDVTGSTADAVVVGRQSDGQTRIYRESREPAVGAGEEDLHANLALGMAIALMPAVAVQTNTWTPRRGAAMAALADHVVRSASRDDLRALGWEADKGNALLLTAVPAARSGDLVKLLRHSIGSETRLIDIEAFDAAQDLGQP